MKKSLHIAISTGQNIANIIPILALSRPGDSVQFISSNTADKFNWTVRAEKVLLRYHLKIKPVVHVDDDKQLALYSISGYLKTQFVLQENMWSQIFVHLTGGQKITAIALFETLQNRPVTFVYMDNQPVQIILISAGNREENFIDIPPTIQLDDLLTIYGSCRSKESRQDKPVSLKSKNVSVFSQDQALIAGLFNAYGIPEAPENIFLEQLKKHLHELSPQIDSRMRDLLKHNNLELAPFYRYIKNLDKKSRLTEETKIYNYLESLIARAIKHIKRILLNNRDRAYMLPLSTEEKAALIKYHFLDEKMQHKDIQRKHLKLRFGAFFEQQVVQRLQLFFEKNPEYEKIVSQVWSGLKIEAEDNPGNITGEYDIFMVLRNGISISMECKTFLFEEKDLFSRLARLTRRTSLLSQQWLVIPFFTEPDLFREQMLHNYINLKKLGIPIIPFGRNDQPMKYTNPHSGEELIILPFETALKQNLKKFIREEVL